MTGRSGILVVMALLALASRVAADGSRQARILADFKEKTGLETIAVPDAGGAYLGKTHRGYRVLYTAKAGNVWGRYAARLTMGEIGREVGGVLGFLTGQTRSGIGGVTGSPLDRLLSQAIGQPLSVTILLEHNKPGSPRLEIVSSFSVLQPEETMPQRQKVGSKAGHLYADDAGFAARIAARPELMKRMKSLRCQTIVLDDEAVAFLWAGSETDYSGMINDHGGYFKMVNAILDDLADIADAIPATP